MEFPALLTEVYMMVNTMQFKKLPKYSDVHGPIST